MATKLNKLEPASQRYGRLEVRAGLQKGKHVEDRYNPDLRTANAGKGNSKKPPRFEGSVIASDGDENDHGRPSHRAVKFAMSILSPVRDRMRDPVDRMTIEALIGNLRQIDRCYQYGIWEQLGRMFERLPHSCPRPEDGPPENWLG